VGRPSRRERSFRGRPGSAWTRAEGWRLLRVDGWPGTGDPHSAGGGRLSTRAATYGAATSQVGPAAGKTGGNGMALLSATSSRPSRISLAKSLTRSAESLTD
jgi:hypothetical protein